MSKQKKYEYSTYFVEDPDVFDGSTLCENCGKPLGEHYSTDPCIVPSDPCLVTESRGLKYDAGKLRYSLIPPSATKAIAEVLTFGAKKYAPNSWQTVENAEERYLDALIRHLEAYRSGESHDTESGLHHLSHLLCNAAFLHYFETQKELHESQH